ncbi:hypothetical protein L3073_14015 [Ancylomarina sp. DW003]|nr:hypothetical protein [Ancylomarina sp. DW003]MDE5423331.1 hypothetical protein [Ancylomarina sp. DW003]
MNRIVLFAIMFIFFGSCTSPKMEKSVLVFSYRILEKEEFTFKDSDNESFNVAKILLNIPDTIVTLYEIANCVKHICIKEDILVGKFYKDETCLQIDQGKIVNNGNLYNDCYIGQMDMRGRGLNWKYKIKSEDFQFNDKEGLPMKIDVK